MISSIKTQLQGLETLVAAISNYKKDDIKSVPRKTPSFTDDQNLTDDEEISLEEMMAFAREQEIKRMTTEAEKYSQGLMQNVVDKVADETQ